jgi:excisionase family DNA binding protein
MCVTTFEDRRLYAKDVAEYLGVSPRTVRWWAATGRLRASRVRIKIWSFRLSDVEDFSVSLGFCSSTKESPERRLLS